MLLMGIKEYAMSREISDKLVRKLVVEGAISFSRAGRKYMLVPEVVDEQIKKIFSPEPKKLEVAIPKQKVKKGSFHAALAALRA